MVAIPLTAHCSNTTGCHTSREIPLPSFPVFHNFMYFSRLQLSSMDVVGSMLVMLCFESRDSGGADSDTGDAGTWSCDTSLFFPKMTTCVVV